jgi:predicted alpha/beta superfamily hydrolase
MEKLLFNNPRSWNGEHMAGINPWQSITAAKAFQFHLTINVVMEKQRGNAVIFDRMILLVMIRAFYSRKQNKHPRTPQFLYGHSLGGAMSLYYCLSHKPDINGAVISAPGLAPGTPFPPIVMF